MKKRLGFLVLALFLVLPFTVHAANQLDFTCQDADASGNITCTVTYNFDESKDSAVVTLTEQGGATVVTDSIKSAGSTWTVAGTPSAANKVWTVNLTSPGASGEGELFQFTYTPSGLEGCSVLITLENLTKTVTPPTADKTTCKIVDGVYYDNDGNEVTKEVYEEKCAKNPKTGSTLPYVALASLVIIAGGAYVATKDKAKMYKI